MKICPTCSARCFDDMELCYGCLHDFSKHFVAAATNGQAAAAASDQKGSLLERDWDTEQDWDIEECLEFDCAPDRRTGTEKPCDDSGRLLDRRALPSPLEERVKGGEDSIGESVGETAGLVGEEKREVTIRIELNPGKACSSRNAEMSCGFLRHAVGIPMLTVVGKTNEESEWVARDGVAKNKDGVAAVEASDGREANRVSFEGCSGEGGPASGQERAACCVTISVA